MPTCKRSIQRKGKNSMSTQCREQLEPQFFNFKTNSKMQLQLQLQLITLYVQPALTHIYINKNRYKNKYEVYNKQYISIFNKSKYAYNFLQIFPLDLISPQICHNLKVCILIVCKNSANACQRTLSDPRLKILQDNRIDEKDNPSRFQPISFLFTETRVLVVIEEEKGAEEREDENEEEEQEKATSWRMR